MYVSAEETEEKPFTSIKPKPCQQMSSTTSTDNGTQSFVILGIIFALAVVSLGIVYVNFPKLKE